MVQYVSHSTESEYDWLQRESQGDAMLLHLLENREAVIARGAKEGGSYRLTDETKVKMGRVLLEIAERQIQLGIDPDTFSPPYDIAQLEQERQIIQQNKHHLD